MKNETALRLSREWKPAAFDFRQLLESARNIAVFGCSHQPFRTSYRIAAYLQQAGYTMIPVNPYYEEILGVQCYPDLLSIPQEIRLDVVNVFRKPRFTEEVVDQARSRSGDTGEKPVIWTQIGVSSQEAEHKALKAGLPYIANRCILVEHERYFY